MQSSLRTKNSNYPSVCLWVLSGGSGFRPSQPGHGTLKAPGGWGGPCNQTSCLHAGPVLREVLGNFVSTGQSVKSDPCPLALHWAHAPKEPPLCSCWRGQRCGCRSAAGPVSAGSPTVGRFQSGSRVAGKRHQSRSIGAERWGDSWQAGPPRP